MSRFLPVLAIGVLVLVVVLYWRLTRDGDPQQTQDVRATEDSGPTSNHIDAPHDGGRPVAVAKVVEAGVDAPPRATQGQLKPGTEEFNYRVDVNFADKLRAAVARECDVDETSDEKLTLEFDLEIAAGVVKVENVVVAESEVNDVTEQCVRNAVETATWKVDDMANYRESMDLFIRLRTLKKYKSRAEFD